jgi:hypothetical protein
MLTTEQDAAVSKAEVRIRRILIDLEYETDLRLDRVQIDTLDFPPEVSIFLKETAVRE